MSNAVVKKKWTIMIYLAGDNDLESAGSVDLAEMKQIGSNDDLNLIAQFDRAGSRAQTRRYYLRKGTQLGRDIVASRPLLRAIAVATPCGFLAIEAGWTVTEVGRQPWVISGILRTRDAVTPMPGIAVPFVLFTLLYVGLAVAVVWLLYRQIVRAPRTAEAAHV